MLLRDHTSDKRIPLASALCMFCLVYGLCGGCAGRAGNDGLVQRGGLLGRGALKKLTILNTISTFLLFPK